MLLCNVIIIIIIIIIIQMDYPIAIRKPDRVLINKEKRTCHLKNCTISIDHWIKWKERRKLDKYLDSAWELKRLWNMKMTIIVGVVRTVLKNLFRKWKN